MFKTTASRLPAFTGASPLLVVTRFLATAMHRLQSRRELRELDARLLADIGLDRAEALEEARKPFWQA